MKWHSCSLQEMTRGEQDLGPQGKNNMGKAEKDSETKPTRTNRPAREKEGNEERSNI